MSSSTGWTGWVADSLDESARRLLNDYQRDFPLTPRPFAAIGNELGMTEQQVLEALERFQHQGAVSRVGAVVPPNRVGASTLAAMAVPAPRLQEVADLVSGYEEVNHNYEREHRLNLWFVVTAGDERRLQEVLDEIAHHTGLEVLDLPLLTDYHIDLGFELQWK